MGAVASGIMAMIGTAIALSLIIGGIFGIINGRIKGNLILSIILLTIIYVGTSYFLGFFLVVTAGALPLIISFLISSGTVRYLEERKQVKPTFSIIAGLGSLVMVSALFILLARARLFPFNLSELVAIGIICSIIFYKLWKYISKSK